MSYRPNRERAHMIGERVSGLMRERHVSVASLAQSVRIQRVTLENYCAGRVIPIDMLVAMARTLQTTVAYLTGASDDRTPTVATTSP
jgi:plasmid maintenance system antidote protein VapI